jgi:VWFA-related protein
MPQLYRIKFFSLTLFVLYLFGSFTNAQTPTPTPETDDKPEKVFTEEIKLNILAFDDNGNFASGVNKEDLVVNEDGRLHQANSLRRIAANVLIVLDVGNEISFAKRNKTTAQAAKGLINALQAEDSVAVIQYGDKVEILAEWTQDREFLNKILDEKKLGIGKRSVFNQALDTAARFFQKTPLENRHLILITDGVDSFNNQRLKDSALKKLLSSDINVHVISYTALQQEALAPKKSIWQKGEPNPKRIPEEVLITLPQAQQQTLRLPRLGSVNTDREMIKKRKEESEKLKKSEAFLTTLAEDTNGEIFLPATTEEMTAKTAQLAKNIDSQYVLTYTPKRALSDSNDGETRIIEVSSRRAGLQVQAKRKLIVSGNK